MSWLWCSDGVISYCDSNLSPQGQIENSGRARQRGQTGQTGGTSHSRWTGHKQDITSYGKGHVIREGTDMQTGKMGKTGDTARKDKQGRQAMMPELSLAIIYTVKTIYEHYQMCANHSEIILYWGGLWFSQTDDKKMSFAFCQNSDPSIEDAEVMTSVCSRQGFKTCTEWVLYRLYSITEYKIRDLLAEGFNDFCQ